MLTKEETDLIQTLKENLNQLPPLKDQKQRKIHLLMGNVDSGKTALLDAIALESIQTLTENEVELNTWYDDKAVYIEVPEAIKRSTKLVEAFTKQIKKWHKQTYIDSILLCINTYKGLSQTPKAFVLFLKKTAKQVELISHQFKQKPRLNLCFTHMDKIAGFCHFFTDPKPAWGYNFKNYTNHTSLLKQNAKLYDQLLKNLHSQLLDRLHATQDKLTRYLIREFPLQMESIGNLVNACVNHLTIETITTTAIYFSCAKQANSAHDRLSATISESYSLKLNNQVPQSSLEKSYFIEGMLEQINQYSAIKPKLKVSPHAKAAMSLSVFLALGVGIHHVFNQYQIQSAHEELFYFNQSQKESLEDFLPALEHLSNAKQASNKLMGVVPFNHINQLTNKIDKNYQASLRDSFLPQMAQQIEKSLYANKTPIETYHALKAYIMLGQKGRFLNKAYLIDWLSNNWTEQNKPHKKKLQRLLNEALTEPYQGIDIDMSLVNHTRQYLQALPKTFLYFNLIEDKLPKPTLDLTLTHFNLEKLNVPYVFQKANVMHIYETVLPQLVDEFKADSFVLQEPVAELLPTVQATYLQNYESFWQRVVNKLRPTTFQSYEEGYHLFNTFGESKSAIETLFVQLQKNTSAFNSPQTNAEKAFNSIIASRFTGSNLISGHQLQQLRPALADMAQFLQTIANAPNKNKTAFDIAKHRFLNNSNDPLSRMFQYEQQLPYPLNAWLKNISTNAWYLILKDTQIHVNQQWQQLVYAPYQTNIQGKFPFSKDESKEVSAANFNQFFKHNGLLNQFFDFYLSPFIDTTTAKWRTKVKDELQLPIQKATIKELIRTNVIREMFFKEQAEEPKIKFTLHALALEPIISDLTLTLNGQSLKETQQNKRSGEFYWPGNTSKLKTEIHIKNISGEKFDLTESGYWGWFKLLSKANLQPYNNDMANFQLILDINGSASKFLMAMESQLNPFIPGILNNFTLPESIT